MNTPVLLGLYIYVLMTLVTTEMNALHQQVRGSQALTRDPCDRSEFGDQFTPIHRHSYM